MSLDTYHAALARELKEVVFQLLVLGLGHEADIHARAVFLVEDSRHEHLRVVKAIVEQVGFLLIALVYPRYPAVLFQPTEVEQCRVDRQYRRRVEHRAAVDMRLIVEHRRDIARHLAKRRLFHNHEGYTRRRNVLLRTAVNHIILTCVNRATEDIRRHIGNQRHITFLGVDLLQFALRNLRTEDSVVGRDVEVIGILRNLIAAGDGVGGLAHHLYLAETLCLFDGFLRPYTRVQVCRFLLEEVIRNHAELQACAAAQEEHAVALGNVEQLFEECFCFVHYGLEILRTVADFKDRESLSLKVQHGISRLLNHFLRQDTRSCIKIVLFHK